MALNLNDGTNPPTPAETDARSDIAKLQAKLEDLQYDYDRRNEDCIRVREALVPFLRQHPMADEGITHEKARAGYVAKVAADVLHYQEAEIERLRQYAETTKYHQDQHAAAVRELEPLKAHVAEALAILDRFNTVPADDVIAETLIDSARNLLAGGAR